MTVLYVFLAAMAGFVVFSVFQKITRDRKNRNAIKERWGKIPKDEYSANDFESVACYYEHRKSLENKFYIDNITWNDLDMNRVFARVNNTQTAIGEEYLYCLMRELTFIPEVLAERNALIEFFQKNPREREQVQVILSRQGKMRYLNISDYISGKRKGLGKSGLFYMVLAVLFVLSPFVAGLFPGAMILFFALMVINVTVYFKARDQIIGHLQSLGYIVNMISTAKRLSKLKIGAVEKYTARLSEASRKIKGISINSFFMIFYTTENYFFEIIKIFFLGEPIAYHRIFKIIEKNKQELEAIYETVGLLDSMAAIASYRESLVYYSLPELQNETEQSSFIRFEELNHPLINNPVPNSFSTGNAALITGSNASGKSTFLKAVAINAIFAQTIYTCLAKEYSSSFFNIYSSMALNDNLEAEESYYIVEIKSIKRIIDGLNAAVPVLCVIDEVLRGTNTVERIAASSEIVRHLADSNCICLCATHDLELSQILAEHADNYHFQEFFENGNIKFDYKIYPGKSNTRNAIKLLKTLGYGTNIVESAELRAQQFSENGHWN